MHVFGLLEKAGVAGENPLKHVINHAKDTTK